MGSPQQTCTRGARTLVVSVLLAGALAAGGCGSSRTPSGGSGTTTTPSSKASGTPSSAAARAAQLRLDGALIDQWNAANDVASKPYACLRKAPRGGPVLASCVSTCQKCTISIGTIKRRVASAYNRSPRYVRTIYHAAYLAQMRNLDNHAAVLRALGEYARVHGASSYAGMTEFARAKALIKVEDASAKVWRRRFDKARSRFHAYVRKLDR